MNVIFLGREQMNLQATLSSASSAGNGGMTAGHPHHPITCSSELQLDPDGRFRCEHAEVPGGDERTRLCVNHSLALLLIELAQEL
jgi:hypothetical protein